MAPTFDVALVNDPLEEALLVHAAAVYPVTKCVLGHDPVDMRGVLLSKPEDPGDCLQLRDRDISISTNHACSSHRAAMGPAKRGLP